MTTTRPSQFDKATLKNCPHGKIFGDNAPQLPIDKMSMISRITHIADAGGDYNRGLVLAELDISPDDWFFACHFSGDPVMPGCLGLDALWQLLGFYIGWCGFKGRARAIGAEQVKFTGQITPDIPKINYRLDIKKIVKRNLVFGVANGLVLINENPIYYAKTLKVTLMEK